jgi:hypothetical protein
MLVVYSIGQINNNNFVKLYYLCLTMGLFYANWGENNYHYNIIRYQSGTICRISLDSVLPSKNVLPLFSAIHSHHAPEDPSHKPHRGPNPHWSSLTTSLILVIEILGPWWMATIIRIVCPRFLSHQRQFVV